MTSNTSPWTGIPPQQLVLTQDRDLGSHALGEVGETTELEPDVLGRHARRRRDLLAKRRLIDVVQPAARVLDHDDLARAEQLLAHDQRANHVIGHEPTGVADDVGVPRP